MPAGKGGSTRSRGPYQEGQARTRRQNSRGRAEPLICRRLVSSPSSPPRLPVGNRPQRGWTGAAGWACPRAIGQRGFPFARGQGAGSGPQGSARGERSEPLMAAPASCGPHMRPRPTGTSAEGILFADCVSASRSRPGPSGRIPSGISGRRSFGRPIGQVRDGSSIRPVLEVGVAWGGRPGLVRGRMDGDQNRRVRSIGHGGSAASAHRALNRFAERAHGLLAGIRGPLRLAHPGPSIQLARGQGGRRGASQQLAGRFCGGTAACQRAHPTGFPAS